MDTPQPASPEAVVAAVAEMLDTYDYSGPLGVGFPAVVREGVAYTASNIDEAWIGCSVLDLLVEAGGLDTVVINDADAAALAESAFGAASGANGLVLMITFGTGIGSGLLFNGELIPNLELGQIELDGHFPAEVHFAAKSRRRENLEWDEWGARADRFLKHVNAVLNPDLIVVGGGLVKHWEKFAHLIDDSLPVTHASMGNNAGIVGAALLASRSRTR